MSIMQEFKDFAVKGNVVDLAVGVIIGAAFNKIVTSLVDDIIMPLISWALGGRIDFAKLYYVLGDNPNHLATLEQLQKADIATLAYGQFITVLINFVLLAFVVFMLVRAIGKLRAETPPEAQEEPAAQENTEILKQIRDALVNKP